MAAAPDQHQNLRIAVSARACPPPMSTAYVAPSLGARPPRHAVAAPVVPLRKRAAGLRARRCEFKRPPYRVESALRRPVGVGTLCAHHCPIEVRRSTGHEPARLSVAASSKFPVTRQPIVVPDDRPQCRASRLRPGVTHQLPDGACGRMKLKYGRDSARSPGVADGNGHGVDRPQRGPVPTPAAPSAAS